MNSGRGELFHDYVRVLNKRDKGDSGSGREKNANTNYLENNYCYINMKLHDSAAYPNVNLRTSYVQAYA